MLKFKILNMWSIAGIVTDEIKWIKNRSYIYHYENPVHVELSSDMTLLLLDSSKITNDSCAVALSHL